MSTRSRIAGFVLVAALSARLALAQDCPNDAEKFKGTSEEGFAAEWCEIDGKKEGRLLERYPSGQVRGEAGFESGRKNGPFARWSESGQKEIEGEYRDDLREGRWTRWHANGAKKDEGDWRRDLPQGRWRAWSEDGAPVFDGSFDAGKREGEWTFWQESGARKERFLYRQGVKIRALENGPDLKAFQVFVAPLSLSKTAQSGGIGIGWAPTVTTDASWLRVRGHVRAFSIGESPTVPESITGLRVGASASLLFFSRLIVEPGLGYTLLTRYGGAVSGEFTLGWRFDKLLGVIDEIYLSGSSLNQSFDVPTQDPNLGRLGVTFHFL